MTKSTNEINELNKPITISLKYWEWKIVQELNVGNVDIFRRGLQAFAQEKGVKYLPVDK